MKFDMNRAGDFLKEWDAHRANRSEVARSWGYDRAHAYDIAERCRAAMANLGSGQSQLHKQNGPQPSS